MMVWPSRVVIDDWRSARQLHVATIGRRSGAWRTKCWLVFGIDDDGIYLLEERGRPADWVRNVESDPTVRVWIDGVDQIEAHARILTDPGEIEHSRRVIGATAMGASLRDLVERGLPVSIEPID
jgi:hypothetical protein